MYGANGIVGYLDDYNTEGEAVYIIKDGSGVGTVSYVTGKCSATGTLNCVKRVMWLLQMPRKIRMK